MNNIYSGKTLDIALNKAMSQLNVSADKIKYKVIDDKKGLIKKVTIEVYLIDGIINDVIGKFKSILDAMEVTYELKTKYEDNIIFINVFGTSNKILIGKNGIVLSSLRTILNEYVKKYNDIKVKLDIDSYQKRIDERFVREIRRLAREVLKTGVEYKLDPMNSYQRLIVHNTIKKFDNLKSKSYGEEPNRYIIIEKVSDIDE